MSTRRPDVVIRATALLLGTLACAEANDAAQPLPYTSMAARIVSALAPTTGERAIVRYDPEAHPELATALQQALERQGVDVAVLDYRPLPDFAERLAASDIYVVLPLAASGPSESESAALRRWLDSGRGRQIHFHWGSGTMGVDGVGAEHTHDYDRVYVDALDVDYGELNREQDAAIAALASGTVRVVTAAGTDLRFRVGDRPFNKQNGDASLARMATARMRIDREIELPAGVVRVAPLESSVAGTIVIPHARFDGALAEGLRFEVQNGVVTNVAATAGADAVNATLAAAPALGAFREFGLGFNPKLRPPVAGGPLPYYGYGAGVVRLSLGDNSELGGAVRGGAVRWFFFPDATVTVDGVTLVNRGRLTLPGEGGAR